MERPEFEELLASCKGALERYVYYKTPSKQDGEDILQQVYLSAVEHFGTLKDHASFKAWLLKIAANKCNDFYRNRAKLSDIPIDAIPQGVLTQSRYGITVRQAVGETMTVLADKDRQILILYYFRDQSMSEIAKLLGIAQGTVKSRLYYARQNFKKAYPYPPVLKGEMKMKALPKRRPQYKIIKLDKLPFEAKWEELMGWMIVPRLGEKCSFGVYDMPGGILTESYTLSVIGRASVHGIEGVEIVAKEILPDGKKGMDRTFVAQLTDTHTRFLSESHVADNVKQYYTFLDADDFLPNWGFGEDNCGNEIHVVQKRLIKRTGNTVECPEIPSVLDVVGSYRVEINGKSYDTILVMDIEQYNSGVLSETYLDSNGRTVLWRRFNRDDWKIDHYKQRWSEKLPENERVAVNGMVYVHWYDCISDYIL